MGDIEEWKYKQKLITPDQAARMVKSGDFIFYGEFALFPEAIDEALAKRVDELENVDIRSVCFTKVPMVSRVDPERKHFMLHDHHFGVISRRLYDNDLCDYVPITYHEGPRILKKYRDCDILFLSTGPMDPRGYFNFGMANSVTPAIISKSKKIVVEINENIPYCLGGNQESIHISRVDNIVEGKNLPLIEVPALKASETDMTIAGHIMNELEDGCCLQLGIGGLPNVVGSLITGSDLKNLGIHSEMLVDSCVDLYESGHVNGSRKEIDKYKMSYTFALGTKKLYDFLNQNPTCASYPVNYINDPRIIALNSRFIAINNAIEVDLFSQVCSESVGTMHKSGTGGQFDFIFGAFHSHRGKGFICLSSTITDKDGTVRSRIVPTLREGAIVTVPRSITHYVVTEYGIAQMKGKSTRERAEALINIAHPQFRDELIKSAERMKIWTKTSGIA